jgi:hypothetical protein
MPRRAAECNRASVELALSPAQRAALADICRRLDVAPTGWHRLPMFRAFVLCATANLAAELRAAGTPREDAILTAAIRMGVSPDSLKTWRRRARRDSEVQVEPATRAVIAA